MDLPFSGVTKSLGGPQPSAGSRPPSPSHSDSNAIVSNIFSNCCGKSNCCKKVCKIYITYIYTRYLSMKFENRFKTSGVEEDFSTLNLQGNFKRQSEIKI